MLETLKIKNPDIKFYSVFDKEFKEYGEVISGLDVSEFLTAAKNIENPQSGAKYLPSEESFEKLSCAKCFKERFFGQLPAQIGYCWGYNSMLNATEWHTSSEINIATTPLVVLLAKRCEIENGIIDSSCFKGFYVPAGTVIETYATTLHFTPCQAEDSGFGWVVVLPECTNTPLDNKTENPFLWAKNKWLIAHKDNKPLTDKGAVGGIYGTNFEVKY